MDGTGVCRRAGALLAAGLLGLLAACTTVAAPEPTGVVPPSRAATTSSVASTGAADTVGVPPTAGSGSTTASADSSSSPSSGATSPPSSGNGPALARDLLASGTSGDPKPTGPIVTVPGSDLEIGVVSLSSDDRGTVLVLALRTTGGVQIPPLYTAEDLAGWRDLHTLRVRDTVGGTDYFPYRYQRLPDQEKRGSTSPAENVLRTGVWHTLGSVVLPGLPASVDRVDILLSTPTSGLLTLTPLVTLQDVPVERT